MQSTALINYGKPIPISKYKSLNQISEAKAINEIRTDVEAGLKPLIINISNDEYYDTIEEIRLIFPELVHHKAGEVVSNLYAELKSGQQLISAIEPWISSNENEAENLKLIVNSIKSGTTALKLKYHLLINEDHKVFVNIVFLILGLPLHVVGVILNYLPYKVPEWFVNKKIKDPRRTKKGKNVSKIIKEFLKIKCPINKAAKELNKFFKKYQINLTVDQRYFPISNNRISKLSVVFSTSFGRQLEYYTGMVFKIDIKSNNKIKNIINGGRYDQLISDLGSKTQVSAVGAALNLNY